MIQFHWNEAGQSQVWEQPGLPSELEASLGHPARPCFEKTKIKKHDHTTTKKFQT